MAELVVGGNVSGNQQDPNLVRRRDRLVNSLFPLSPSFQQTQQLLPMPLNTIQPWLMVIQPDQINMTVFMAPCLV